MYKRLRIAKDFSREVIQLANTKRPPIKLEVEEGVTDKLIGESRTYKLCMQSKEEKSPVYLLTIEVFELDSPEEWLIFKKHVKQVLKGQNVTDVDALYTLVWDLLRGNALTAFNKEQA
eukprot:3944955-Ditylum_brightwellii.AAC.1